MVVLPQVRNQGVGSKLLDYAIQFAKEQGCQRISLLTDSDNEGRIVLPTIWIFSFIYVDVQVFS